MEVYVGLRVVKSGRRDDDGTRFSLVKSNVHDDIRGFNRGTKVGTGDGGRGGGTTYELSRRSH